MMLCPKCGKENAEQAAACAGCGAPLAQAPPTPVAPKTDGLAIAALVLGVLGLFTCGLGSLVGIVLGLLSLRKIGRSGGRLTGQTLAIIGLALSAITLLFGLILGAILMPVLLKAREKAHEVSQVPERVMEVSAGSDCINNMKHLALGLIMYSNDWDEMLPPADRWSQAIEPYVKSPSIYVCPQAPRLRCGYALNRVIAGNWQNMTSGNPKAASQPGLGDTLRGALGNEAPRRAAGGAVAPAQVVMLFESDRGWNASGGPEALPKTPRHNGGDFYAFWDGHCQWVRRGHETTLEWSPKIPRGK